MTSWANTIDTMIGKKLKLPRDWKCPISEKMHPLYVYDFDEKVYETDEITVEKVECEDNRIWIINDRYSVHAGIVYRIIHGYFD